MVAMLDGARWRADAVQVATVVWGSGRRPSMILDGTKSQGGATWLPIVGDVILARHKCAGREAI